VAREVEAPSQSFKLLEAAVDARKRTARGFNARKMSAGRPSTPVWPKRLRRGKPLWPKSDASMSEVGVEVEGRRGADEVGSWAKVCL